MRRPMSIPAQAFDRRGFREDRRRSEPHPITEDLAEAITSDAIELLFQPQFSSSDNALLGAEALVRWEHPDHGKLAGDALVAISQSGGIARRLSRHIARAAFAAAVEWPTQLRLSLNVTAMDLFDRTFGEELLDMLGDSGFPAERLTLD